jgi:(R,R)-butanediol dehydrogenase/meso-butanediol dehydrogenase/diacetyl reductase
MTVPATVPATMPAAVFGRRAVTVEERPVPELGPNDVLVEVSYCGVCGSDLHFVIDGWGKTGSIGGHEWSGVVAAVGSEVSRWSIGDPVVGGIDACGSCRYCQAGRPTLCTERGMVGTGEWQGAFAGYVREPEGALNRIPDGLSLRVAALAEPLAVALHGITLSRAEPGKRVLVTGAGPIGSLVTAALIARGVTDVTVSEPGERRRALATELGAVTVTPDQLVTPDWPQAVVDEPFDAVLECSGKARAMEGALGQLATAGTLVLVGAGIEPPRFDPNRIILNELVITGAFCYDGTGFTDALDLLASGRLATDLLIDGTDIPLTGLLEAMEGLAAGDIAGKVMVAGPNRT